MTYLEALVENLEFLNRALAHAGPKDVGWVTFNIPRREQQISEERLVALSYLRSLQRR